MSNLKSAFEIRLEIPLISERTATGDFSRLSRKKYHMHLTAELAAGGQDSNRSPIRFTAYEQSQKTRRGIRLQCRTLEIVVIPGPV